MRSAHSAVSPAMCGDSTTWSIAKQRIVRRRRLVLEDVEAGGREAPLPQRRDQRRLVDHAAAGGVHENGGRLHHRELRRADHRPVGLRRMDGDEVGPGEAVGQVATGATGPSGQPWLCEERIDRRGSPCRIPPPCAPGAGRSGRSRRSSSRLPQSSPGSSRLRQAQSPSRTARSRADRALGGRQQQHHRLLGHRDRVHVADDGERDAALD